MARSRHTRLVDRVVVTFPDGQTVAFDLPEGATVEVQRPPQKLEREAFKASLTGAESRVLAELAHRPDTRSRLAQRLGVTTSTLDNHLAAIKRKLLDHLETAGQGPVDGYLSIEAVIGWAHRYLGDQKS